jgi:ribosome-binding protein aMBF1 (putative translation factor)
MANQRKAKKRTTSDAVEILYKRFVEGKPEMQAMLAAEETRMDVAEQICRLRTDAGLTQKELAEKIGTTASVICRLENADYEGHSLSMLRRIATGLNQRVKISFVPQSGVPVG